MFVDMHHHFVYGIDDGAQTREDMKNMLLAAYQNGAEEIVATPHATPGREPFRGECFLNHLREANQICSEEGLKLKLHTGCEILYTDDTVRLLESGDIPTLADTGYVLVEFLPQDSYERLRHAARTLGNVGYQPIFAHIERYECLRKGSHLAELHEDYQVIMQVNASTFLRAGFFERRWLDQLMRKGYVDLVSSDAHSVNTRRFRMHECFDLLKKHYGAEAAQELCHDRAKRILSEQ
ncbi:MAG: hypothetical protein IKO55_06450 [Kiritimatiellae bacterium]|nr:hypothetical protein [Kiritimatiellia bacterium]